MNDCCFIDMNNPLQLNCFVFVIQETLDIIFHSHLLSTNITKK